MPLPLALLALIIGRVSAQVYTGPNGIYTVTQDTGADVNLASKSFDWPNLPYHADSGDGVRGTQEGYNICNSTTANQHSMCQTGFISNITHFCLFGSATPKEKVGNVEQNMVLYCTTSDYGTRVIPKGALQGVQFIETPDYVEVVGQIDQTKLNLLADDEGGEEDPLFSMNGRDGRGNPLGSLMYTSAFGPGPLSPYVQTHNWAYFIGSGTFCFKACKPGPNAALLCNHIYDRIGCNYNDPANYAAINGTFQSCQGEDQLPPGVYVQHGVTQTWYQPPEGQAANPPYTPVLPATSQCSTYDSTNLFDLAASSTSTSSSRPTSISRSTVTPSALTNVIVAESASTHIKVPTLRTTIVGLLMMIVILHISM